MLCTWYKYRFNENGVQIIRKLYDHRPGRTHVPGTWYIRYRTCTSLYLVQYVVSVEGFCGWHFYILWLRYIKWSCDSFIFYSPMMYRKWKSSVHSICMCDIIAQILIDSTVKADYSLTETFSTRTMC